MKKDKDKSKKNHESTIGKIIYGFLLFLPLLAIAVKCEYAIFNKNAYQSYDQQTELINVDNSNKLESGSRYRLSSNYTTTNITNNPIAKIKFNNVSNLETNYTNLITNINNLEYFNFTYYTINYIVFYDSNETQVFAISLNNFYVKFDFDIVSTFMTTENIIPNTLYKIESSKLDNVFYSSIKEVQQSPLFNWTTNSLLYTGMNEFTTSLSITTPFIPLLLTYWLIISVVYFLYDIVLVILTVLHRKIHNLQDSI